MAELIGGNGDLDGTLRLLTAPNPGKCQQADDDNGKKDQQGRKRAATATDWIVAAEFHDPSSVVCNWSFTRMGRLNGVASRAGRCIAALVMLRNDKYAEGAVNSSLVLVGLMGVGKSTIGRRLAARLGLPFVDADEEIERAAGMSIQDIFDKHGEAAFRDGERRVIARLIDGSPKVVATGGGAFVNDQTRELILDKATAIWLDADIDILVGRVSRRDGRPLLKGKNPRDVLLRLAEERTPFYAQAPIRVRSTDSPHEATVDAIIEALGQ